MNKTDGSPQSILVVTNSFEDMSLLSGWLDEQGYAIRTASDSLLALSAAKAEPPSLILLDLWMPDLPGYDLCEQFKSEEQTRDVPVLFFGNAQAPDRAEMFSVGAYDYLCKPLRRDEVVYRVGALLAVSYLRQQLAQKSAQLEQEIADRRQREEIMRSFAGRLQILHDIDQSILAAHAPEKIAIAAVGRIRQLIPCQRVMVIEMSEVGKFKMLAAESSGDVGLEMDVEARHRVFDELALRRGHVVGAGDLESVAIRSLLQQSLYQEGIRSYVAAPLFVQGELVGVLWLETSQPQALQQEHITVAIEIASLLAIAIQQVRLYKLAQQEIAERELAEQALRQYTIELEARNVELDAFAHTVAHDLKTPLSALVGYSALLERRYGRVSSEQVLNGLHVITQNARKMSNIIDELLLLASVRKVEEIDIQPLDMARVVTLVRGRLEAMIEEYNADIVVPEAWPLALGYGPWIEEVWVNYVSNAIKYGGRPPRAELGYEQVVAEGDKAYIRFWVRDNGMGIPLEQQDRLFKLFTRLDQIETEGHGLGLSIVKRIVEKLGGQVGVESQAGSPTGQGSVFWFTLPRANE